jgi:error-prone DNA polymerase
MFIELHSRSAFSFLEGASLPEDLIATAAALEMPAMALLDRDGIYGAPRFHLAAKKAKIKAHIGAEVACESLSPQSFSPRRHGDTEKTNSAFRFLLNEARTTGKTRDEQTIDNSSKNQDQESSKSSVSEPALSVVEGCLRGGEQLRGEFRLPLLAANRTGYQNLCRLITKMKSRAPKDEGAVLPSELEEHAEGLICLTGGDNGPLAAALAQGGASSAYRYVQRLVEVFGHGNVYVELQRHFHREEEARNRIAIDIARSLHLPLLATNGVCYATAKERQLSDVFTALRHHQTLATAGRLLERNSERHLKSSQQMGQLFADLPEAIANTVELSSRLEFTLKDLGYQFPKYPVPEGETMMSFLRQRTDEGARWRYGISFTGPAPLSDFKNQELAQRARRQIERELKLIEKLELAGYFLIVWDIVRFCREQNILAQGRGSAANSAVCYSLGITAVDPVGMDLLFERFLSEERGEWPDIDIDLPSGDQRERAIQYVYQRYGERGAAMTANVITYRNRMAAREMGKALGFDEESLSKISAAVATWEYKDANDALDRRFQDAGLDLNHPRLRKYFELCMAVLDLPRHLGQHSGGMVICQGQLDSVVPLEPASMPGRVVVQWDKEDCADMGIVKVDLLGLGMMAVLEDSLKLIRSHNKEEVDLAHLPQDDSTVYSALQKADTVGMFQIESRAQMSCLPRLRPRCFYDIVVQVAIIRPGPIVGQMVNPFLQRRQGREAVTYAHPSLEPVLKRTLGVPLFQEQLLRMAMVVANFTGGEAEELRRAMGFKRSQQRMHEIEAKLRAGMKQNGIAPEVQEQIVLSITSFALYGFPESHAASFALIAYASAYLKCHYLAAFTAALLNNQPMGFYHPATIVKDAQRHGLKVLPIDVTKSDWNCTLESAVSSQYSEVSSFQFPVSSENAQLSAIRLQLSAGRNPHLLIPSGSRGPKSDLVISSENSDIIAKFVIPSEDCASHREGQSQSRDLLSAETSAPPTETSNSRPSTGNSPPGTRNSVLGTGYWALGTQNFALRLGLRYARGLREQAATALLRERFLGPFVSIHDLTRRVPELRKEELATLAEIGALNSVSSFDSPVSSDPCGDTHAKPETRPKLHRRDALWQVERAVRYSGPLLEQFPESDAQSPLRPMTHEERLVADFHGTGLTVGPHPMAFRRAEMNAMGIRRACDLANIPHGQYVRIGGCVIARQRPGTARGFVFLSLEDETGIANAIVTPHLVQKNRILVISERFLLIEGILQNQDNVISVKAERLLPLSITHAETSSHDFH